MSTGTIVSSYDVERSEEEMILDGLLLRPKSREGISLEEFAVRKAVVSQRYRMSRKDKGLRDDDGNRVGLDERQHNLLMDKGIIPFEYAQYRLTRRERARISSIKTGGRITRNAPRPTKKMLREHRSAMMA